MSLQPNQRADRTLQLVLIGCILIAFALRVYRLDAQSLWYDEGVTATLTQRSLPDLTQWTARDIQPPLYYYVVAGWGRLTGWSEWALRFVSVWWGLLIVPLLAQLARRLHRNRATAIIAALFAAFHPLFVYYSQEARMYTMVVALGIAAGYLLLRAVANGAIQSSATPSLASQTSATPRYLWLAYLTVATAAVYTHYFAFFLLLAFFITGLLIARQSAKTVRWLLGVHLGVGLLFAAWAVPLFMQLTTDRSYWQGTFKVSDALYSVFVRFAVGETVLEANAAPYLVISGVVTLVAIGTLGWRATRSDQSMQRSLLLTTSWLLLPIAGVLTLALFIPKFNERYVLLALPALLLLWSVALGEGWQERRSSFTRVATGAVALLLLLCFQLSLHNWFTDHSFLKAQWREAAAYVRLHHEPGEAVVLVSGHAWPVWEYYAPDLPAIRLPDLEILDVDAVLNFRESGARLREALEGHTGVWLVNWQDEVVDPTAVVPIQLDFAADEKTFRSEFWEVGLRHFVDLNADAIPVAPSLLAQPDANFDNQLTLHGYGVTEENELLLFWQLGSDGNAPDVDWQVTLQTETSAGLFYHSPATRRPTGYTHPVARWQPGELVMGVIPAIEWAGPAAMPDTYQIQLGIVDPAGDGTELDRLDSAGIPQGKRVTLTVPLTEQTKDRDMSIPNDIIQTTPDLRLHLALNGDAGEPGQSVLASTLWYLEDSFVADTFVVRWRRALDETNVDDVIAAEVSYPLPADKPMADWPRHDWLRQVVSLQVPLELAAGDYWISLESLEPQDETNPVRRRFTVLSSSRSFVVPPLATEINRDFYAPNMGQALPVLRLLGLVSALPAQMDWSTPLTITTIWQQPETQSMPLHDYTISLQFLDSENRPVAQIDEPLSRGTSTWLSGEVVSQTMTLPSPAQPGRYRLIAVVYDPVASTNARLVTVEGEDFILLDSEVWMP